MLGLGACPWRGLTAFDVYKFPKRKILFITFVINHTNIILSWVPSSNGKCPLTRALSGLSDCDLCAQGPCCMCPVAECFRGETSLPVPCQERVTGSDLEFEHREQYA